MKLSYNKVFDRYYKTFSDKLAEVTYSTYKYIRLKLEKIFPLSDMEGHLLKKTTDLFSSRKADVMPMGFDYLTNEKAEGFLNLDFLDFFDYLPKEHTNTFLKELKKCVSKNKVYPFGVCRNINDVKKIDNLAEHFDGRAFSHIVSIEFTQNGFLKKYAPYVQVSLMNLSPSFLVVKYRLYVRGDFNNLHNEICKSEYFGYTEVSRQYNIPWYKPKRFGKSYSEGNQTRKKKLYELITNLKWTGLQELRKYFTIYFFEDNVFPPTFETYSTNIRPDKKSDRGFWDSVMFGVGADYAPKYNACVCWDYRTSNNEGIRLAAYCGGNYAKDDFLPEIAHHDIADIYAVYLVACTLNMVAQRDIAICNKSISNAIRKSKSTAILKVRVDVEQKLYYSYRFINEFSGNTIDYGDTKEFHHEFYKEGSVSSRSLEGISKRTIKSKEQIDVILKMLNDAAEYRGGQSNIRLQWIMMVITVLSLVVAVCSVNDNILNNIINSIKDLITWFKTL